MAAEELDSDFTQDRQDATWVALDPNERIQLEAKVKAAGDQAGADETALRAATNVTVNLDATESATHRDSARIAKVLADIRRAEARRAAEAAKREEAARRAHAAVLADQQARADAQRASQTDSSQTRHTGSGDSGANDSSSSSSSSKDSGSSGSDSGSGGGSRKKKGGNR
jgi:membrane protein involved in colicin uptake